MHCEKFVAKPNPPIRRLLLALGLLCLLPGLLFAQAKPVSGTVLDDNGKPAEGVSVTVKGQKSGTATDADGKFTLSAEPGATLILSSVSFRPAQIKVGDAANYTVRLELAAGGSSDVVVVGYSTQKKVNLTGSVSVINKDVLENRPVTNAVAALQGAAPGLVVTRNSGQPGNEGYNLNIRGFSSLNGTNSPLVIVDGVEGDLSILNPNDIENISVLKDASASAIYGAKAASGVIIVTTKKGRVGKPKLEYTNLTTFNKRYRAPELLNSWEQAEAENRANINAGRGKTFSDQQIEWLKNGKDTVINAQGNLDYYYNTDVVGMSMKNTTSSQNHNLALSGGNDNTQYLVGLGYFTQDGIFKFGPDQFDRYNARFNVTQKINNIFSLDSRINYSYLSTEAANNSIAGQYGLMYTLYISRRRFPIYLPGSNDTKYANSSPYDAFMNLQNGSYNNTKNHNINGVFTLKAENFIKGLSLRAVYSPGLQLFNNDAFNKPIARWNYTDVATPANYNPAGGSMSKSRITQFAHNVQALADYNWKIGSDHNFHVLGGFEYKYYNYNLIRSSVVGLISNNIESLNTSTPNSTFGVGDDVQANAWVSYFGRLNYDYKGKYLFEANVRNDASSRLAPGHRSQTFPAFSVGWALDKEGWFSNLLPVVNQFKLRGSWGKLGNAQLGALNQNNYSYIAQLSAGANYPLNNVINQSYFQNSLPSSGLGWETIQSTNFGVDIALLKNRLTASFDYFVRENNDMLIGVNYPSVLGVGPRTTNGASMRTKGWEATLGWQDRAGKVSYHLNFNIGDNTNEITKYNGQTTYREGINTAIVGYSINSIFGFVDEGYFTSQDQINTNPSQIDPKKHAFQHAKNAPGDIMYKDINGDGKIDIGNGTAENHGDLVYLGNTNPRYTFGINIGAEYKGFDISIFAQGAGKIVQYLTPNVIVPNAAAWIQPFRAQMDYWTPENLDAKFPRPYNFNTDAVNGNPDFFNGRSSTHWLQNAAYLRLKNLQVGYTLPANITQKVKIQKARIFFTGQDLWETTKMWYPYFDPENPYQSGWSYPFFRSYAVGLNVTF
jgi:TonB-linked SusC/RagA family outer membrane protein